MLSLGQYRNRLLQSGRCSAFGMYFAIHFAHEAAKVYREIDRFLFFVQPRSRGKVQTHDFALLLRFCAFAKCHSIEDAKSNRAHSMILKTN